MPVFNGARYVGKAIDTVLSQTFTDWELVVVDDGSADATPGILDNYTDCRLVKIRQDNAGEARARNVGLEHAAGQYIAFLDADDLYLPNALADLSGFLDLHPEYDVAFSDGYICDEHDQILIRLSEIRSGTHTGDILEPLVLTADVIAGIICTMTRRTTIERYSIRFDENMVIGPDWDFWIQLARYAQFGYLDKLTCMYRVHHTNITRTSGYKKRTEDLLHGRMKILNAAWFEELSTNTRQQFFYQLLVDLLADQPDRQKAILHSEQFRNLPLCNQAELWRHVGVDYLLRGCRQDFAVNCLLEAVRLWPDDGKSKYLLWISRFNSSITSKMLRVWRVVRKTTNRLRSKRQQNPKPVPTGLGPVGE